MKALRELPEKLPAAVVKPGARWVRIHSANRDALWFGPAPGASAVNRFDDPEGQFRVCYLATSLAGAFAETFLRNPPVRILAFSDLATRLGSVVEVRRRLRLVTLYGPGLSRIGVTSAVASEKSYEWSQGLSRKIWLHPDRVDGLIYRSRHDDSAFSVALFDRARDAVASIGGRPITDDPRQLAALLKRYAVALTR